MVCAQCDRLKTFVEQSMIEINDDTLYYFTALNNKNQYETVFAGWLRRDLIKAFQKIDGVGSFAHIRITLGENTFIANVGSPLYLLNYENDDIFMFAEDNDELNLYPSGNLPPELDMDPVIDYPPYFTEGVEPLIEFKLFNKFWAQRDGLWVQLEV
jgi:hypothetical protein